MMPASCADQKTIAYLIDPRMPGGTSSAVAQELRTISQAHKLTVHGLHSRMFKGNKIAPQLEAELDELHIRLDVDPLSVSADVVILHNPAFLKFQDRLGTNVLCRELYVVTHENFLRPDGLDGFDINKTLDAIEKSSVAQKRILAPISEHNSATVRSWLARTNKFGNWSVLSEHWFNICDFEFAQPSPVPMDRRGRLSRPGYEKFPSSSVMEACFPKHAEMNLILGADTLMDDVERYPHWELVPFRGMEVSDFFANIDFMVYYTAPTWRESFGRVLAEAIGEGKLTISDAETAATFRGAVIAARPNEVDDIVAHYVANPKSYVEKVLESQRILAEYSPDAFRQFFERNVTKGHE